MRYYELTYLISPELSEEELKSAVQKTAALISEKGGALEKIATPVRKTLAYPIKKWGQAFLETIYFNLEPEKLVEIENQIKADSQILRHILIVKKIAKAPKTRRVRPTDISQPESQTSQTQEIKEEKPKEQKKVALKEIDKKIEEILGE